MAGTPDKAPHSESSQTAIRALVLAALLLIVFFFGVHAARLELSRELDIIQRVDVTENIDERRSGLSLAAQQRAADWTLVAGMAAALSVPLSAIGIFFIYMNLREATRVSKAAEESLKEATRVSKAAEESLKEARATRTAELRAYLVVSGGRVISHGDKLEFQVHITNRGRTPSVGGNISRKVHVSFDGEVGRASGQGIVIPSLGPEQSYTYAIEMTPDRVGELDASLARALEYEQTKQTGFRSYLVLTGTVEYRDIFAHNRQTVFRLKVPYRLGKIVEGEMSAHGHPNYMN